MNLLSIGGSDPSSGAGIQNDIRVSQLLDFHCLTVVTAVTSQNTSGYSATHPVPPKVISDQFDSIVQDFEIDVVKTGMMYDIKTINAVCGTLERLDVPIIADPVLHSTTGGLLMEDAALPHYTSMIIPLAYAITPNFEESLALSCMPGASPSDAADALLEMGAQNIVITGIDCGDRMSDYILTSNTAKTISHPRINTTNHGSGCTFSAALAAYVGRSIDVISAVTSAAQFTRESILNSRPIGRGIKMTHMPYSDTVLSELASGISRFVSLRDIHRIIPECQTNFVYSRPNPRSIYDVAGVAGRIVRGRGQVIVAGGLEFGGSQHVASALLAAASKFPQIRSAINIMHDPGIVKSMRHNRLDVKSYDRSLEPEDVKNRENSSIPWGINHAMSDSTTPPDAIFHLGAHGKEPMMILFGTTPDDVICKLSCIRDSVCDPGSAEET